MAFTGQLGTFNSQLGNIQLGIIAPTFINQSVFNTLILTDIASFGSGLTSKVAFDVLSLTQLARGFNGNKRVLDILPLAQVIAIGKFYRRVLADALNFGQAASVSQIRTVSNPLTFNQSVTVTSLKGANNSLTFTQSLGMSYNPHFERVVQPFSIIQVAVQARGLPRSVNDTFTILQEADGLRVRSLFASNVIIFRDHVVTARIGNPNDFFGLTQSARSSRVISRSLTDILKLSQSMNRKVTYGRSIAQTLNFNHTHIKQTEIAGNTEIISIPDVIVTKPSSIVILRTPERALTLREPLFGDTEGGLSKLIQQRTSVGGLFTYVRRNESRKLKYTFEIPQAKMFEVRSYIFDYLSTPMYLENWKGEIFYGYIVNNPFVITSKRRAVTCDSGEDSQIEIEFEAIKVH